MKNFCMPSDFKTSTIDKYSEINTLYEHSRISETYGQLTSDHFFGSCRSPKYIPQVDSEALRQYIQYSRDKGIEFNYIINPTCMANDDVTSDGRKKFIDFLEVLQDMGVNSITLALPSLMEITRIKAPDINIKASTVCQINSAAKAKFYEDLGIKRIVIDEDIYRNFTILESIRKVYKGALEVIVNSFCLNDCPYKMFHYNSFSHSHEDKKTYPYYSTRCKAIHMEAENFLKLNWIRPEDIKYYTDIGIDYFKLQGRTNIHSGDPAKAVTHYIEEYYDGDLISLLELFSSDKPLTIADIMIDNRKLDGFLEKFVFAPSFCTKVCNECSYCKEFSELTISNTDRGILELLKVFSCMSLDEFTQIPASLPSTESQSKQA